LGKRRQAITVLRCQVFVGKKNVRRQNCLYGVG
jgi:hypothetical protein